MYKTACPSCGAEVQFRSAASVMAVCEYCQSTLLKDADTVKDIGKMSAVLEDFSPIQLGTSGVYQGRHFSVVGRIQLRYEHGLWNEWYALFDDGAPGWLSDASGQYVFTLPEDVDHNAPPFAELKPGYVYTAHGEPFFASDVRTARCVAGQGELPFQVGQGWQAEVADFRRGTRFITLDYSDGTPPQLYRGEAVTLEQLRCQLLREADAIQDSAGRVPGKIAALDCPNCGGSIAYQPGMTYHMLCPSCHAEVECSTGQALVLQKHAELAQVHTTLALGAMAKIDGSEYELIGLMRRHDGEGEQWTEYLLFNPTRGFLWLVETDDGWQHVQVLNEWPDSSDAESITLQGQRFEQSASYQGIVSYAAGAFNWRVAIGDRNAITDYTHGNRTLTAESDEHETTWSRAQPASPQELATWFGDPALAASKPAAASPTQKLKRAFKWMAIVLVVINLPMLVLGNFFSTAFMLAFGLLLLWVPVWLAGSRAKSD
jgi:hypothetical protein